MDAVLNIRVRGMADNTHMMVVVGMSKRHTLRRKGDNG
jgi:hypothetical protein